MKNSLTTIGCICLLLLPVSCVHLRTCSGPEMVDMKDKGLTAEQIDTMCTSTKLDHETFSAMGKMAKDISEAIKNSK
jgi:hypothetical protein